MAFEYFACEKIDIAVIEVGLGGRLDSTNIITPELSVITNIGLDHTQMLGDTLSKIAFEKAGIIKDSIPVVIGEVLPETRLIFEEKASRENAPLIFAEEKRYVPGWNYNNHHLEVSVAEKLTDGRKSYRLDLPGVYQTKNILTVLEAVHQLQQQGWHINEENIEKGLAHTRRATGLHGRWEVIQQQPTVVLDVAHNVDGIKQLAEQIELSTFNILHVVIGMVKDKDVIAALALLPKYANYYFTKAQLPRALPETELAKIAGSIGLHGQTFGTVAEALNTAKQHAHKEDLILVCGSVFVVAEV